MRAVVTYVLALLAVGCSSGSTGPDRARAQLSVATSLVDTVRRIEWLPIDVRLTNLRGEPVRRSVEFEIREGKGLLRPEANITDAQGVARTALLPLGPGTIRVEASVPALGANLSVGSTVAIPNASLDFPQIVTAGSDPAVSPDGHRLALVSGETGRLMVIDTDGQTLWRSTAGSRGSEPSWAPDGTRLAFTENPNTDLASVAVIDLRTGDIRRLVTPTGEFHFQRFGDAAWSPDGRTVAFSETVSDSPPSYVRIGLYEIDRGEAVFPPGLTGSDPAWSPDGTLLACNVGGKIMVRNTAGETVADLSGSGPASASDPSWSPDGGHLVFMTFDTYRGRTRLRLAVGDVTTHEVSPVLEFTDWVGKPDWSPLGDRIFFEAEGTDIAPSVFSLSTRWRD